MKKLLVLLAALLLALPFMPVPDSPAQAEAPQYAIITLRSAYGTQPSVVIEDAAFLRWLQALLNVDAPCEPFEARPAHSVYTVTFYDGQNESAEPVCWVSRLEGYTIVHDDLYNRATITRPDGSIHAISIDLPEMLRSSLYEPITFAIPESHRALLQKYSWTIAFRHPHMLVQLPAKLAASRTDPAALHFTWADLFLRDAGYDITPHLGKAVVPYVYTLYETVPRAAFTRRENDAVRCAMYAVVLECDGQIIGAYLMARSWDGSDLLSLKGNAAADLLGDAAIDDYLLARLPVTAAETALATLPPEEVITRYGAVNDPALMAIRELLRRLGTASSTLYDPLALSAVPTGDTVTVLRRLDLPTQHMYEVETANGLRFPELVYQSDSTGWKIVNFYNTGI